MKFKLMVADLNPDPGDSDYQIQIPFFKNGNKRMKWDKYLIHTCKIDIYREPELKLVLALHEVHHPQKATEDLLMEFFREGFIQGIKYTQSQK